MDATINNNTDTDATKESVDNSMNNINHNTTADAEKPADTGAGRKRVAGEEEEEEEEEEEMELVLDGEEGTERLAEMVRDQNVTAEHGLVMKGLVSGSGMWQGR